MKYLKRYKIFESHPDKSFFDNISDILEPIKDDGFYVEIHNNDGSDELMESEGECVRVYIERPDSSGDSFSFNNPNTTRETLTKPYMTNDVILDSIQHLLSYVLESDYELSFEAISESHIVASEEYPGSKYDLDGIFLFLNKSPIDYIRLTITNQ